MERKRKGEWKICRKCGSEWNVSIRSGQEGEDGYICPKCKGIRIKHIKDGHVEGMDIGCETRK